jgi:hypothetical protein
VGRRIRRRCSRPSALRVTASEGTAQDRRRASCKAKPREFTAGPIKLKSTPDGMLGPLASASSRSSSSSLIEHMLDQA